MPTASPSTCNCPNDRYINDEAICQAFVGMLGRIGIKANLVSQSRHDALPADPEPRDGFLPARLGRADLRQPVCLRLPGALDPDARGGWNGSRYSNPEVDAKIKSLATETDLESATRPSPRSGSRSRRTGCS
jgi:peptide/nickel transport system substrate-binding protein